MLTVEQIRKLSNADLLSKIAEEASEVIKAICKQAVHGERPHFGGVQYDNVRDANEEAAQLSDLLHEYRGRFGYSGHRMPQQLELKQ
jgi:phosphoribosyl-ATP pyrophosphohydrolase